MIFSVATKSNLPTGRAGEVTESSSVRRKRGEAEMGKAIATITAAVLWSSPLAAQTSLSVVEVNAPAVNCVFQPSCVITVSDTVGRIALPYLTSPGSAFLQSRIFPTAPDTPAAGLTGYVYRISLTEASGSGECISGLVLNFGPVVKLPYLPAQQADVFVITTGGLGTIGIKSAQKSGDVIDFAFSKPLCVGTAPDIKNTTFFFGLASSAVPKHINAQIYGFGQPPLYAVDARVPNH
jgi:hypothetical protein